MPKPHKKHKNAFDTETRKSALAFGAAVKEARRQLGLAQKDLAKIVGGKGFNIKQIESAGCSPRSSFFRPLCEELGLDPYSFGFTGQYLSIIDEWAETLYENS